MPEPQSASRQILDQIALVPESSRPLIVCDVDEVILHLITHLEAYLNARDMVFLQHTYKLTGNIAERGKQAPLAAEAVRRLLEAFFNEESHRQQLVDGADTALANLTETWDIVLLTNLPGTHNKPVREQLLARLGIPYPVLTNFGPKGGAVAALSAGRPAPVVFIDDSPTNHASVNASLPSAVQIQFIADDRFRANLESPDHIALLTGDWNQTETFIRSILVEG